MAGVLRGEIRWAQLEPAPNPEQSGARPVLILSEDVFNEHSGTVIAVVLTSQPQLAGFPLTLKLGCAELPWRAWAKIGQIRTLAVDRIGGKVAQASAEDISRIIEGLNEILGA